MRAAVHGTTPCWHQTDGRNKSSLALLRIFAGRERAEKIIERVVRTYGMIANLTTEQAQVVRQQVAEFIKDKTGDENALAVQAIRHLRAPKPVRTRRK